MTVRRPESPYLLPPGPERRAMMVEMGITVCLLDYNDEEWAAVEASSPAIAAPRHAGTGETDPASRLA